MCEIDWSALAGWAQVLAIVATGCIAIWVAKRQLDAYRAALEAANQNERFRNTIKALDDLNRPQELHGQKFSPLEASSWITAIAGDDGQRRRYMSYSARVKSADSSAASDARWIAETNAAVVIATSYYLDIGMLLDRKLVDLDYLLLKIGPQLIGYYDASKKLELAIMGSGALGRFAELARSAQAAGVSEGPVGTPG